MARNSSFELRWLRRYKWLACIGITAVVLPPFRLLTSWVAGPYTLLLTLIGAPLILLLGYIVQWLLAPHRPGDNTHGLFESKPTAIAPGCRLLAFLLVGIGCGVAGWLLGRYLLILREMPLRDHLGPFMLAPVCACVGIIGCLLVPYSFHHLLNMRNMTEFFGVFAFVFGLRILWFGGLDLLLPACVWIFFLCFSLCVNQANLLKNAYFSSTCYATGELRRAGILATLRMFLLTMLLQIPLMLLLSFLVMPLRLIWMPESRYLWDFPFEGAKQFNLTLFFISLIAVPLGGIALLLYARKAGHGGGFHWFRERLRAFWFALRGRILSLLPKRKRPTKTSAEPPIRHYVDTKTTLTPEQWQRTWNTRSFLRRLSSLPTNEEKYNFAYRVLVSKLLTKDIGLHPTQTPHEMTTIVTAKTTLQEMTQITEIYLHSVYAKDYRVTSEDVEALANITRYMLDGN